MRLAWDDERKANRCRVAALLLGTLALAGCSSASSVGSPDSSPSLSSRLSAYFSGSKEPPATAKPVAASIDCPGVDVRAGASTLNITSKAGQATAGDLRYQVSFGQLARECLVAEGILTIKVGVQGRVIIGP